MTAGGFESRAGASVRGLVEELSAEGVTVEPLFGMSEDKIRERVLSLAEAPDLPDMGVFYHVSAEVEDLEGLAERLRRLDEVAGV